VRDDRALVLLAIPWALAAQPARELVEAQQRLLDLRPARAHAREATYLAVVLPPPDAGGVAAVEVVLTAGAFLQSWTT